MRPSRARALALAALAAGLAALAPPARAAPDDATVVLVARSIGSRRGQPLDPRAHAALLVRWSGRAGGLIVQGGPVAGQSSGSRRLSGWAIPAEDPAVQFGRAEGAWWGEAGVRELPTRELGRFVVQGLGEARLRAHVEALNRELAGIDYRLEAGPSSNSYVSRMLERLGLPLPPLGDVKLPGWGWRP